MLDLPVEVNAAAFENADECDALFGYMAGFDNEPCSSWSQTTSFYRGWRNGLRDAGHAEPSAICLAEGSPRRCKVEHK